MKVKKRLTNNQFFILSAVAEGRGRAYGVSIRNSIAETQGKNLSSGRICEALKKFVKSGWVTSSWSAPIRARGGRRRKLYEISMDGLSLLSVEDAIRAKPTVFTEKA